MLRNPLNGHSSSSSSSSSKFRVLSPQSLSVVSILISVVLFLLVIYSRYQFLTLQDRIALIEKKLGVSSSPLASLHLNSDSQSPLPLAPSPSPSIIENPNSLVPAPIPSAPSGPTVSIGEPFRFENFDTAKEVECLNGKTMTVAGNSNGRALYFRLLHHLTKGTAIVVPDARVDQKAQCDESAADPAKRSNDSSAAAAAAAAARTSDCKKTLENVGFIWNQMIYDTTVEKIFATNADLIVSMAGLFDVLNQEDYTSYIAESKFKLANLIRLHRAKGKEYIHLTLPPLCTPRLSMKHVHEDTNKELIPYNALVTQAVLSGGGSVIDYFSFVHNNSHSLQLVHEWERNGCTNYDDFIHPSDIYKDLILEKVFNFYCRKEVEKPFYHQFGDEWDIGTKYIHRERTKE